MNQVLEFLKTNTPFYLATLKDKTPKIRPLGLTFEYKGKIIFGVGSHKQVYKQLLENPLVEIATTNQAGNWLRLSGHVVFDENPDLFAETTKLFPQVASMYPQGGPKLAFFYLKDATAQFCNTKGELYSTVNF
ncbi:MAG: pyridoxamine 5'-phosphate oxidase family protein [Deltaproteobacteria bacterium]|jgi:uncharacterized pyridoxamine 5'-phosphate oxidase family protein|nr:pyridoxamine 5'-phosphate oxidase family protein [Deltaproteobacteria bacterium]